MTDTDQPADIAETHISVIAFIGDRAYKLKKPVDLGFVDFTTRASREQACHAEVSLNRRLAPDVYLGVADVIGPDGELADHLVVMRRMPTSRRLATLVSEGDPMATDQIRDVARLLADFHSGAERSRVIDEAATTDAVRANWDESFAQLQPFGGEVLDQELCGRVETLVHRYLAGREPLFALRISGGHVCDGHGDLQAADIFCLDDGPRVLDCVEFSDRFRHGDVIADVAFLAMDLERLGAADLGASFLRWYREFAAEICPASLVEHYVAYRAHVRSKVNCLRLTQLQGEDHQQAVLEARRLLHMTHRYLERSRVRLVLVGGLPGTGKSTVARCLADRLGWTVLRSDEIRKEIAGIAVTERAGASFEQGLYTPEMTDQVYAHMMGRARIALGLGETVVLDASWSEDRYREAARALAVAAVADIDELRCVAPQAVTDERMRLRLDLGADASDATPEVAHRLAQVVDSWSAARSIDTSGTLESTVSAALAALSVESLIDDVVP
jgi:hypothetical protein